MEQTAQEKANIKAGTVKEVDLLPLVGRLVKDHFNKIKEVRVPALTFTFTRGMIRNYWSALWGGHTLPFRLRIDGETSKETLVGRLGFAVTFIVADSIYLLGKFGSWILKKLPWKLSLFNVVMVAGLMVGFIGWGLPMFLDQMNFMQEIEQTKTMQALQGITLPEVTLPEIELGWAWMIPIIWFIGSVPFSIARFKKWSGVRSVLGKTKPILGDGE